ncbi:MAG: hypothetical protein AAFR87_20305 [Bacteroidota bacterium]
MKNILRYLAFLAPILQLATALIASSAVDFNRPDTDDMIPVPLYLEPGGFAFVIWPVIFITFILLGIYQLGKNRHNDSRFILGRKYIVTSCLGNIIWFYGDVYNNLFICTIGFVIMLISLLVLNNIFQLGEVSKDFKDKWLVKMPVSLFFGWITVAFPIGITLLLISEFGLTGEDFLSPAIWSSFVIVFALGIFLSLFILRKVSTFFVGTGVWGFFWIFMANRVDQTLIAYTAIGATIVLSISIFLKHIPHFRTKLL